jgi:hypothetical protein
MPSIFYREEQQAIMKRFLKKVSVISLVLLAYDATHAQETCPVTTIRTKALSGHVFADGRNPKPINATKLELRKAVDDSVLKVAATDSDGFFSFEGIPKGTYLLATYFLVGGVEMAPRFDVVVKVTKNAAKKHDTGLQIRLGANCFESKAAIVVPRGNSS